MIIKIIIYLIYILLILLGVYIIINYRSYGGGKVGSTLILIGLWAIIEKFINKREEI